jgi:hypothetical protein
MPRHCLDCDAHKVIMDPDPYDWFCDDDCAVVCTLAKKRGPKPKNAVYATDRQPFKTIAVGMRPYQVDKKHIKGVPDWCPKRPRKRK